MIKDYNKYTFEKKELKEGLKDFLRKDIFSNKGWNMVVNTNNMDITTYPSYINTFKKNEICIWENPRIISSFDEWWSIKELEEYATNEEIKNAKSKSIDTFEKLDYRVYKDNLFNIIKNKDDFIKDFGHWLSFDNFFEIFVKKFNKAFENLE